MSQSVELKYSRVAAWQSAVRLDLLNATLDLVFSSSDKVEAEKREWFSTIKGQPWYWQEESTYFEPYGIRYLGELAERHAEKFGPDKPVLRAVVLAIGFAQPVCTDAMFIGEQFRDFMRRLKSEAEDDSYLQCAIYLLEPGMREKISDWLVVHSYGDAAELIFALNVLRDDTDAYGKMRPQLVSLLGCKRTMPVYGNAGIFAAF